MNGMIIGCVGDTRRGIRRFILRMRAMSVRDFKSFESGEKKGEVEVTG